MKLKPIGSNMNEVEMGDITVLFSYQTPVAFHKAGEGYSKTNRSYSSTTTRHINKWLDGNKAKEVEQEVIDNLVK